MVYIMSAGSLFSSTSTVYLAGLLVPEGGGEVMGLWLTKLGEDLVMLSFRSVLEQTSSRVLEQTCAALPLSHVTSTEREAMVSISIVADQSTTGRRAVRLCQEHVPKMLQSNVTHTLNSLVTVQIEIKVNGRGDIPIHDRSSGYISTPILCISGVRTVKPGVVSLLADHIGSLFSSTSTVYLAGLLVPEGGGEVMGLWLTKLGEDLVMLSFRSVLEQTSSRVLEQTCAALPLSHVTSTEREAMVSISIVADQSTTGRRTVRLCQEHVPKMLY
eukprot:sb/3468130/